jgi:predicted GNAT family acetyltransferase
LSEFSKIISIAYIYTMSTGIPTNKFDNRQSLLAQDQARNRAVAINLQNKFVPTRAALWAEYQSTLYSDILHVRNIPTLQNLLANEMESNNQDDTLQTENLARRNLSSITDEKTTAYILDRLTMDDMNNVSQNFPQILRLIKEKYMNMNKNKFIDIVKSKQSYIPEFELSERGQRRKDQMNNDYEEVQNDEFELRGMRQNDEFELRSMRQNDVKRTPEKGVGGKILGNIEDMHDDEKRSPDKSNPMRTPTKKEKGFYGNIFTSPSPKPTNQDEMDILDRIKSEVNPLKVEQLKTYLKRLNPNIAIPQYSSKEYKEMARRDVKCL